MRNSKPLTARVYDEVYSDIINGRFGAQDIITESALVQRFGVSKSPVREALLKLCNEDVLRVIPRLGYMVVQITPIEIRELTEFRNVLELYMLEKGFPSLTEDGIEELEALNELNLKDIEVYSSPLDNWQRNMKFHLKLASYAQNMTMYSHLEQVLQRLARATTQHFGGYDQDDPVLKERSSSRCHIDLVEAFRNKDLATAKGILEADINTIW
ncbi:MAG: GntR family transcriptional regulator [Firmicutes bacterium]|nr:GntR family transcriptional regulator [Bacillota bacterium]